MEEIKTAHWVTTRRNWRQVFQNVSSGSEPEEWPIATSETWMRLRPAARATRTGDAATWIHEIFDERGARYSTSVPKLWRNMRSLPLTVICNTEYLLNQCLFPPPFADMNLIGTSARERRCEWQQRTVAWEGRSLIRWHREYVQHNFAVREIVLSDPETHQIVRKEHRETNLLTGLPSHHTVCDRYTYNEDAPTGTFEISADREIILAEKGMPPCEVWSTLSAKEQQAIRQVIARSDAGWQRADFKEFSSVWQFSFWSILPRDGDWEKRLRQQAGIWRPWHTEVLSARIQDYIPMAAATDASYDTQERRRVLRVDVKVRVEGDEDTWESEAQYYLRRRFGQYKIVHWEFPWEEIKASPAWGNQLMFGARRAFDDVALQEAAKSGDEGSLARHLMELPSFAHVDAALHGAATVDIVRSLVGYGGDVQAVNYRGETPLFSATNVDIARLLVELGADVRAQTSRGGTPLYEAIVHDRLDVARFLIDCGAEVNDTTVWLGNACSAAMAQMLIDHGISVDLQPVRQRPIRVDEDGEIEWGEVVHFSPLMAAASAGHGDVVELLLRLGANVDVSTDCDGTALILALSHGHFAVARTLLDAGADVRVVEQRYGDTALHKLAKGACVRYGKPLTEHDRFEAIECLNVLIAKGADPRIRNNDGEMPVHIAMLEPTREFAAILDLAMARLDDPCPPLPGAPHSERIRCHPHKPEAVTVLRYGGLARWSLEETPRLLVRAQTCLRHFRNVAVSPDGELVAVAADDTIELRRWDDLGIVATVHLEKDEKVAAIDEHFPAGFGGKTAIVTTGIERCSDLAFSPHSGVLVVAARRMTEVRHDTGYGTYWNSTVHVLDCKTGRSVGAAPTIGMAKWIGMAADGSVLACGGEGGPAGGNFRLCVHSIKADLSPSNTIWCDSDAKGDAEYTSNVTGVVNVQPVRIRSNDTEEPEEPENRWQPAFLVHGAISPASKRIAYFGTSEYWPCDGSGELAVHALNDGVLQWHRPLNSEIIGEGRFQRRDYFDHRNHTEVMFLTEDELVCTATCGTLLFFNVATGQVTRRHYFDTEADVLSIDLERNASTLWAALSDGRLVSLHLEGPCSDE